MITIKQFTELAHRTASRYSHRSEPEKVSYTFLPHTLEHFYHLVCAAIEADRAQRVPDGWLIKETERNEIIVQAPSADPGGLTIPPGPGGSLATRLLESLCRALIASTPAPAQQPETRCPYCDGTGDVHSIDGEWRGTCHCQAGETAPAPAQQELENALEPRMSRACLDAWDKSVFTAGPHDAVHPMFLEAFSAGFKATAQHQEQPQQERGPMTDEERHTLFAGLLSETVDTPTDMFRLIVERVERHHGIRKD